MRKSLSLFKAGLYEYEYGYAMSAQSEVQKRKDMPYSTLLCMLHFIMLHYLMFILKRKAKQGKSITSQPECRQLSFGAFHLRLSEMVKGMNEVNVGVEEGERGRRRESSCTLCPSNFFTFFFFKGGCCPRLITFHCAALEKNQSITSRKERATEH